MLYRVVDKTIRSIQSASWEKTIILNRDCTTAEPMTVSPTSDMPSDVLIAGIHRPLPKLARDNLASSSIKGSASVEGDYHCTTVDSGSK
ncbi:hypothetical protein Tco_1577346 [Tanacetum coccineum]